MRKVNLDYDPCAARPCLNGATCSAKAGKSKTTYECFCAKGFGGMHCEQSTFARATQLVPLNELKVESIKNHFIFSNRWTILLSLGPCDVKPCKNGGVCRTTRGTPAYFCECLPFWGGKECDIRKSRWCANPNEMLAGLVIPEPSTRTYGKNVQLLSSGKAEWIEDLKRRQPKGDREMKGTAGMRILSRQPCSMRCV